MIKVKTSLTPTELAKIGQGLVKLAKKQSEGSFSPENEAESKLIGEVNQMLGTVSASLQNEVEEIFK